MPVEGTITVVTQSNELMSMGDIIAIIVAIISLLGVIVSTLLTKECNLNYNLEKIVNLVQLYLQGQQYM